MDTSSHSYGASESEIVTASYHWDLDEYSEFRRIQICQMQRSTLTKLGYGYMAFATLFFLWSWQEGVFQINLLAAVVIGVPLIAARGWMLQWVFKRQWQRGAFPECDVTLHFSPTEFGIQNPIGEQNVPWQLCSQIHETSRGFILYTRRFGIRRLFYWVPFHAFETASSIEQVRRYMRSSGARYR